jgi:hypothetical protein
MPTPGDAVAGVDVDDAQRIASGRTTVGDLPVVQAHTTTVARPSVNVWIALNCSSGRPVYACDQCAPPLWQALL